MTKTLIATAVALTLAATAALAQAPVARGAVDADRDGRITRAEAAAHPRLAAQFDTLDANRDGVLDPGERPRRGRGDGAGLKTLDTNNDGRLSRAEAAAVPAMASRFDTLDANRDGYIDAQERPHRGSRGGKGRLDADHDGRISRSEAAANPRLIERFATLDTNRNGYLDAGELPRRATGMHGDGRGMAMLDTDKDGRISRAEAATHPRLVDRFATLDTNGNGYLEAGERPQGAKGTRGRREGMAGLDTDKDGRITRAEAATRPQLAERFAAIDTNRDGVLTREELKAAHVARRAASPTR